MSSSKPFILAAGYDSSVVPCPIFQDQNVNDIKNFYFSFFQTNRIISSSNNMLIAAGNPSIHISDINGKTSSFIGHRSNVTDVVCVDNYIYSCSEDCTIKIWDTNLENQCIRSIPTASPLNSIQVTSNKFFILVANERGEVELYESTTITKRAADKIKLSDYPVRSLALSNDNKRLIAACHDGFVFVLSLDFSKNVDIIKSKLINSNENISVFSEIIHFKAHENLILRCVISPDQQTFVTTSADSSAKLWNFNNYQLMFILADQDQKKWVWDAAYTNDSEYVVTGGSDDICRTWDISTGKKVSSSELNIKGIVSLTIYYKK